MATIKTSGEFNNELNEIKDNLVFSIKNQIKRLGGVFDVGKGRFAHININIEEAVGNYDEVSYYGMPQLVSLYVSSISKDGKIYASTEDDEYNDKYVTLNGLSINSLVTILSKLGKID